MGFLSIFAVGLLILVGALALNFGASQLGLMSWYDFLKSPQSAGAISYLWLFVAYPFGLGVVAYYSMKLF